MKILALKINGDIIVSEINNVNSLTIYSVWRISDVKRRKKCQRRRRCIKDHRSNGL